MMMQKFHDKKYKSNKRKMIRLIISIFLVVIVVFIFILLSNHGFFNKIARPFWRTRVQLVDETKQIARSKSSVISENEKLISENTSIKNSMLDYEILKNENIELKNILNRIPNKKDIVISGVLSKPIYSPYDTIIIDAGSDNNISKGNKVYASGDIPIGVVNEVYDNTSLVTLYSNPTTSTMGTLEDENINVELIGRGGSNFEMTIPSDIEVEKGKLVMLPGTFGEVVAIVEDIISSPASPVKKVLLKSPINIQNVKWVEVQRNVSN